jgi:hypothetical protein
MNDFCSDLELFLHGFDADKLTPLFMEHFKYGTADVYIEKGKIVAAVRWNISKSGKVAHIIDLFIANANKGVDSVQIMRYFGFRGKEKFPKLEYIKFDRGLKQGTTNRVYKLSSLTK